MISTFDPLLPVIFTTAVVDIREPAGAVQDTVVVFFGPFCAGAVLVRVQLMAPSTVETTDIW